MKKRQKAKYLEETNKLLEKHMRILIHHITQNFLKYSNEINEINSRYFEMNLQSIKNEQENKK